MLGIMSGNDKNVFIWVAAAIFGDEDMRKCKKLSKITM